jgi:hypothetical protein
MNFDLNFDYEYYLNNNIDLRQFNKEEAYSHWINFGIKEGRSANYEKINFETNITIIIHLFHESLFDEFLEYINNVKKVFNLVTVIFTININSNFDQNIKNEDSTFIILKVENKGVDVYPFIESINYIRKNNIKTDFILKMHTKVSSNLTADLINWRKDLIEPITKIENLYIIQHYFKKINNIGYIGSQKCIMPKNYDIDFPQNIQGINELCDKFSHLEKNWTDFNGGNIFWINNEVLNKYLTNELIEYLIENFSFEKPPCNLTNKGIYVEYLCERLFTGIFCYDKTNILVNNFTNTQRSVSKINGKIDHSYFYEPKIFSIYKPKDIIT